MALKEKLKEEIVQAIRAQGFPGATTTEIERTTGGERHTLTKYLQALAAEGRIASKPVANSALWYVESAATQFVAHTLLANSSFAEHIVLSVISQTPSWTCVLNRRLRVQSMDYTMRARYGDCTGEPVMAAMTGGTRPQAERRLRSLLHKRGPPQSFQVVDKRGNVLAVRANRISGEDSKALLLLHCIDVSGRERISKDLRRLQAKVKATDELVCITDADGTIIDVNKRFEQVTGYRQTEAIGQNPRMLKSGHHTKAFYKDLWKTITAGNTFRAIAIDRKKDGTLYCEEKTITPIKDGDGTITHFLSAGRAVQDPYTGRQ